MKLKGINPIERHVEKIVLGLVFVALLAALAMQFLLKPNQVDVGAGRAVAPENIYLELAKEAEQLKGKIDDRSPSLPRVQETDLLDRYQAALDAPTGAAGTRLPPLVEGRDVLGGVQVVASAGAAGGPVMAPRVPAPATPVAHSQWGTLDPYTVEANESLARMAPAQQPYDVPAVSVEAVFSGVELERALATAEEGRRAVPGGWRRQVEIVRVEAQRERLDPATGQWADAAPGTPLPTGYDPIADLKLDQVDLSTMLRAASDARQNRRHVLQPRFAPLIAGPRWKSPTLAIAARDAMGDINSLPRLQFELAKAERNLADLEGRRDAATSVTRPDPSSGGGGGRTGTTGAGRPSTPGTQTGQRSGQQNLDRRIAEARDEVSDLTERVRDLEAELADQVREERAALDRPLFEQETMRVWAHDFAVEPGGVYRYRVRAVVNNPLFKKGAQLDPTDPEQQSLTRDPLVYGEWSEWTEPVAVGAKTYYFVTSAATEGQVGATGASASVEVYHMYYGHYRSDITRLAPSDAIAVAVDLPEGFVTFDTAVLDAQGMRRYIEDQTPPGQDTPEGVTRVGTDRDLALAAHLLEVSTLPITREAALGGAPREVIQAVFRDTDGSIRVHRPADALSGTALQMARESAQAGQVLDLRVPDEKDIPRRQPGPARPSDRPGGVGRPVPDDGP